MSMDKSILSTVQTDSAAKGNKHEKKIYYVKEHKFYYSCLPFIISFSIFFFSVISCTVGCDIIEGKVNPNV